MQWQSSLGIRLEITSSLKYVPALLVRVAFVMATALDPAKYHNEHFWYPFIATLDGVIVTLRTTAGLHQ